MIEIELIASKNAVAHLLPHKKNLNPFFKQTNYKDIAFWMHQQLLDLFLISSQAFGKIHTSIPFDTNLRIHEISKKISNKINSDKPDLWPLFRALIQERLDSLNRNVNEISDIEPLMVFDPYFFSMRNQHLQKVPMEIPSEGDAHVHVGGAISWDSLWTWIMNRDYPPAYLIRAKKYRLFTGKEIGILLSKARQYRKNLFEDFGIPFYRQKNNNSDALLFRRIKAENKENETEVRDYVLIRCALRREMLCGSVRDLDEFSGSAWKRFWGQRNIPGISHGLMRRFMRIERLIFEDAVKEIVMRHGIGRVSFRMKLPPKKYYAAQALQTACNVLTSINMQEGVKTGLVIQASRAQIYSRSDWDKKNLDRKLTHIDKLIEYLKKGQKIVKPQCIGFDIAGPEKRCPKIYFSEALERLKVNNTVTIHAGEDFYDPWNALWRVYKVMKVFNLKTRIGHGSILGINPYQLRWGSFSCPVWARKEALESAKEMINDLMPNIQIEKKLNSMKESLPYDTLESLELLITVRGWEKKVFLQVQKELLNRLSEKNAIIESNPTSNSVILGIRGYEWLPTWGLCANLGLRVIIGTDDPGILNTCIEEEYARLSMAFEKRKRLEDRKDNYIPEHLKISGVATSWNLIEERLRDSTRKYALIGDSSFEAY